MSPRFTLSKTHYIAPQMRAGTLGMSCGRVPACHFHWRDGAITPSEKAGVKLGIFDPCKLFQGTFTSRRSEP